MSVVQLWFALLLCVSHGLHEAAASNSGAVCPAEEDDLTLLQNKAHLRSSYVVHYVEEHMGSLVSHDTGGGSAHSADRTTKSDWLAVAVLGTMMLGALSSIWFRDGFVPFMIALLYVLGLILTRPFVKDVLKHGFAFPYSITAFHMLFTCVAASLAPVSTKHETWRSMFNEGLTVLPVSLMNGLSLALSNTSLMYGTAAFVTMIGSCSPATMFIIEVLRGRATNGWIALSVAIVCCGGICCTYGETHFAVVALLLSLSASFFRSSKSAFQHVLLQTNIPPIRLVAWSGFWSFFMMLPAQVMVEGMSPLHALPEMSLHGKLALLASALTAGMLNVAQCYAVKNFGPLLQNVVGQLQLIVVLLLASAWLNEEVTLQQWMGVLLIVSGCVLMTAMKAKLAEKQVPVPVPPPKSYGAAEPKVV